jgi:hypothetical protein
MMREEAELELYNNEVIYKKLLKSKFIYKVKNIISSNASKLEQNNEVKIKIDNFQDIKVNLKNKNLSIIVNGEEIYVKLMTLPKVGKEKMYFIVKNELQYRFKNIDNIIFTYEIFNHIGKNVEVIVFCMNWNRTDFIDKCLSKGAKIKGICPIQFKVLNYYRKRIKEKEYIILFQYDRDVYLLACVEGKIIANSVINNFHEQNFLEEFEKFQFKYSIMEVTQSLGKIFLLNFPYDHLIKILSDNYECCALEDYFK